MLLILIDILTLINAKQIYHQDQPKDCRDDSFKNVLNEKKCLTRFRKIALSLWLRSNKEDYG